MCNALSVPWSSAAKIDARWRGYNKDCGLMILQMIRVAYFWYRDLILDHVHRIFCGDPYIEVVA